MSVEEMQADEALRNLQLIIRQGRDTFGFPAFAVSSAVDLGQAIEILVDRRIAVRERQILEEFRRMLEVPHEPA